ncbi:MAG: energy transducer TonB [Candidatus Omnitrophica bacterium]|nr:energy transducer TonB [Candidatus Omnitrophota bacterium]
MPEKISFRICILLSFLFHAILFFPWSFIKIPCRAEVSFRRIELTYFKNEMSEPLIKERNPIMAVEQIKDKKDYEAFSPGFETGVKKDQGAPLEAKEEGRAINIVKDNSSEGARQNKADIKDPRLAKREHEEYCLTIRERIKDILKKHRNRFNKEGEVYVKFKVDKHGLLRDLALAKGGNTSSGTLEKIALESVKEASPFPPFTQTMQDKELFFKLPIRFVIGD